MRTSGYIFFSVVASLILLYIILNVERFSFNFETPFFEVLNIIIVLFLAFWIPWVVNKKEEDQKNAKSIIISEIDSAGRSLQKIDDFLVDCLSIERERVFISVNFMLKTLSHDLHVLRELVENECNCSALNDEMSQLIDKYMSYHKALTGDSYWTPSIEKVSVAIYSSHYTLFKELSRSLKFFRLSVNRH